MKQNIRNNKLSKFHMINDKQNSRGPDQSNKNIAVAKLRVIKPHLCNHKRFSPKFKYM